MIPVPIQPTRGRPSTDGLVLSLMAKKVRRAKSGWVWPAIMNDAGILVERQEPVVFPIRVANPTAE
jgi:hypothetical protein